MLSCSFRYPASPILVILHSSILHNSWRISGLQLYENDGRPEGRWLIGSSERPRTCRLEDRAPTGGGTPENSFYERENAITFVFCYDCYVIIKYFVLEGMEDPTSPTWDIENSASASTPRTSLIWEYICIWPWVVEHSRCSFSFCAHHVSCDSPEAYTYCVARSKPFNSLSTRFRAHS